MRKKDRSKNALKHGAFSRELILPGESRKEYERLDKTIKRLAQVKGYKKLGLVARVDVDTSKLIDVSPPNKAIESAGRTTTRTVRSLRRKWRNLQNGKAKAQTRNR